MVCGLQTEELWISTSPPSFMLFHYISTSPPSFIVFSGFSVGFCINEEEGYLLPTIARKNNLPTFALMTTGAFSRNVASYFSEL